ncbi:hypothetical protein ACVILK_005335 [Bradyrhizobium embrapense]
MWFADFWRYGGSPLCIFGDGDLGQKRFCRQSY